MKGTLPLGIAVASIIASACCACGSPAREAPFDPMPPDPNYLSTVLGPTTGTGSRTLTVTASRAMSITIGCIGKGVLTVSGPLSAGAVLCYDASRSRGAFASYYWAHVRARSGEHIMLRVAANASTIWDIRVDGLPRNCKDDVCTYAPQ